MTTLDASPQTSSRSPLDEREIETFLFREARLLDEHRFDEWLTLWAADGVYWVPIGPEGSGPLDHVSIIYDDRVRLQQRVRRLNSEHAWAHVPQSYSARLISNVEIRPEESAFDRDEVAVSATMLVGDYRAERQEIYCGRLFYRLRVEPDGVRIILKKVSLINRAGPLRNISAVL